MARREDAERLVREALRELIDRSALRRVWTADASLWTDDPAEQELCRERLGWLNVADDLIERVDELESFAAAVRADGVRHVVLCGMGGSSLAPGVLANLFPPTADTPSFTLLDTTDPVRIAAVDGLDPGATLFVIASKSGTTIETDCLRAYFTERVRDAGVDDVGSRFIAISDPGSPLIERAQAEGYRAAFESSPDIGGRYSALSLFGLVPAALLGIDLRALLESARREAAASRPGRSPSDDPCAAMRLGAAMGGLARAGVDKLTLLCSPSLATFGAWVEQLVGESTGKKGRGIIPVNGEPIGLPAGRDRLRVRIGLAGEPCPPAPDGKAVEDCAIAGPHDVGALFFRFELATALASALLRVEPFDQPDVEAAKQATVATLARGTEGPGMAPSGVETLRAFLGEARPGDYVAILSFVPGAHEAMDALDELRVAIAHASGVTTTLGIGPRYLHSTGQLHKGGPATPLVVLVEGTSDTDRPIPGRGYTFGRLFRAQAEGDARTLAERGRRFLRTRVQGDAATGLRALASALHA